MMGMFSFISFASSRVEKLGRATGNSVIGLADGDAERGLDAEVYACHGLVSRPSKATKGIRIRLGSLSIVIAAFTYGVEPPSNPGATKLYGTDADGAEKVSAIFDSDGKMGIKNASEQFAKLIDDLITELKTITTFGSPTNHTLSPSNVANLAVISTRFKSLLKEI